MQQLPSGVIASGWIPFAAFILMILLFSWLYINYFKSKYDSELSTTVTAVLALSVALFTTFLIPVDVFLVSFMKTSNGTFKEWADNADTRQAVQDTVLYAYYALYGCMGIFIFVVLPFVYFFYEEQDEYSTCQTRVCSSMKYTTVFVLAAAVLILIGSVVPLKDSPPENSTEWQKIEFLIHELGNNKGEDILSFVVSVLSVIGMTIFIVFAGYGISALPCGMIKGVRSIRYDREDVQDKRAVVSARISVLKEKYTNINQMSPRDKIRLYDLEEELRMLDRQERYLEDATHSWLRKCFICLRPCEMFFGVALSMFGFLIFLSLIITNVDKAMNSLGPKMGYALPTRKLPNPVDIILVNAQTIFPLDYILFGGLVMFCLFCAMSGLRKMGIWFLWIRMYRIRPRRTKPQGLLMLCMSLMFMILAINIVLYSITPQYVMYGSQQYWANVTDATKGIIGEELIPCSTNAPPDECIMSRTSMLLTRFCYKAWIFGATYYWSTWAFLLVVVIGSLVSIFRKRPSNIEGSTEEDEFDESDEELLRI